MKELDDRAGGSPDHQTHYEAVQKAHILRTAYEYARNVGATHGEILAAHGADIEVRSYGYARGVGATHREVLDAQASGTEVSDYGDARRAGATHRQVLAAFGDGVPLDGYTKARKAYATHDEAMSAHQADIPLRDYAAARSAGAAHQEIMAVDAAGMSPPTYTVLRRRGMTHPEILAVHEIATSCRAKADEWIDASNNATPAELAAAHRAGVDLAMYRRARAGGETHNRAMGLGKLRRATVGAADFACYLAAREMGATHEEALLLSPHPGIHRLEWWQRDLILKALRSLAPKQWSPAEVEIICGLSAHWDNSPQDLAEAACKTTR